MKILVSILSFETFFSFLLVINTKNNWNVKDIKPIKEKDLLIHKFVSSK